MIKPKDIKNFDRLIKITKAKFNINQLTPSRYLISAMIINKNRFVIGFNDYNKTHPFTLQVKPDTVSKHAEIDAISRWNFDSNLLPSSTIYLCGLTIVGNFCISSKPCHQCLIKLNQVGIKRVIYFNNFKDNFNLNELIIPNTIDSSNSQENNHGKF